jgi:hypothetical protein
MNPCELFEASIDKEKEITNSTTPKVHFTRVSSEGRNENLQDPRKLLYLDQQ